MREFLSVQYPTFTCLSFGSEIVNFDFTTTFVRSLQDVAHREDKERDIISGKSRHSGQRKCTCGRNIDFGRNTASRILALDVADGILSVAFFPSNHFEIYGFEFYRTWHRSQLIFTLITTAHRLENVGTTFFSISVLPGSNPRSFRVPLMADGLPMFRTRTAAHSS